MYTGKIEFNNSLVLRQIEADAKKYFEIKLGDCKPSIKKIQLKEADELRKRYHKKLLPTGSYEFVFGGSFQEEEVQAKVQFTISYEEIKTESVTEQFLLYLLQVSYLDSVREYMKQHWFPGLIWYYCKEKPWNISPILGAGLYDEPMRKLSVNYGFEGVIYATKEKLVLDNPCKWCKGKTGCNYCMLYLHKE